MLAPPSSDTLTAYDLAHFDTYLRLLDSDAMSVDWKVTAREVLALDADADIDSTRRVYETHLARASWMTHTHWLSTAPEVTSVEGLVPVRARAGLVQDYAREKDRLDAEITTQRQAWEEETAQLERERKE